MFPNCILPIQATTNDYQTCTDSKGYDRNGFVMKAMQASKSQHDPRDAKQYIGSDVHSYASHKDVVFIVIATFLLGIAVISIFLGICFEVH